MITKVRLTTKSFVLGLFGVVLALFVGLVSSGAASAATVIYVPGTKSTLPIAVGGAPSGSNTLFQQIDALATSGKITTVYPMEFKPFTGLGDNTLEESVSLGVPALQGDIEYALAQSAGTGDDKVLVFSLSQGGMVASRVQSGYVNDPNAPSLERLEFVYIASPVSPTGVLARFSDFGRIPVLDIPLDEVTQTGQYNTTYVTRQYDGIGHFPVHIWNGPAVANALIGAVYYHGDYSMVSLDESDPSNMVTKDGNVTYVIRKEQLPILRPFIDAGLLNEKEAAQLDNVLRPIIDAGYGTEGPTAETPAQFLPTPADVPQYANALKQSAEAVKQSLPSPAPLRNNPVKSGVKQAASHFTPQLPRTIRKQVNESVSTDDVQEESDDLGSSPSGHDTVVESMDLSDKVDAPKVARKKLPTLQRAVKSVERELKKRTSVDANASNASKSVSSEDSDNKDDDSSDK